MNITDSGTQTVTIGEGQFIVEVPQKTAERLRQHNLLDNGLLHLLNGLADLLTPMPKLPWSEISVLLEIFHAFLFDYKDALYAHLLNEPGPEGIGRSLWVEFADSLGWPACVDVLTDMPAAVLEETAQDIWDVYTDYEEYPDADEVKPEILRALSQRSDIYGSGSLPPEFAFSLLIEEGRK